MPSPPTLPDAASPRAVDALLNRPTMTMPGMPMEGARPLPVESDPRPDAGAGRPTSPQMSPGGERVPQAPMANAGTPAPDAGAARPPR